MRRITATLALVLTTGLGLSACSSGGSDDTNDPSDPSAVPSSAAPSTSAAPAEPGSGADSPSEETEGSDDIAPADIAALALTAPDFPAPYTFAELPPGALEQGGDAIAGALAGATFDPPECGAAAAPNAGADLSQAGVAVAADQSTGASIAELVTPSTSDNPDFSAQAEACQEFSFTLDSPAGPAQGQASVELLEAPDVAADRVQAARTTVDISVGGQKQTIETTVFSAELRGVVVIVTGSAPAGASAPDAVLSSLLIAGVAKVAAA